MEMENSFLSQQSDTKKDSEKYTRLTAMLQQVMTDLNNHGMCTLTEGTTITHLKVVRVCADPLPVLDHQVPIFLPENQQFIDDQWDLTTHQVTASLTSLSNDYKNNFQGVSVYRRFQPRCENRSRSGRRK